jgi:putative endonuclease
MSTLHLQRGIAAEDLAANHVERLGLLILARNLRCRAGELDLVCLDDQTLAIIEVRQRAQKSFGGALASVTWRKQRKLIRAAEFALFTHPEWCGYRMRFDVLAIEGLPDGTHEIVWVKDAFRVA